MNHIPPLIYDLGIILSTAGAVLILFRLLRQPIVLGYLMAGVLLSPHTHIFPAVKEPESISIWAEIGVIFLLFGLGLEFSFRKLVQVGRTSVIGALVEISLMLFLGFSLGQILGWSKMDSVFLGGILAISSTAIIIRAFEELGLKGQKFTQSVFGMLIIEDIVAVLLLVLLSTIGLTQSFSGEEMLQVLVKLGFYLLLWFMVGLFLVPLFLKQARSLLTDEMSLIVGLGLCLLMVILAADAGFSPALGAFVMGSILAETREGQRIERLFIPIRNLFSAVFFVSVGMLIDVSLVWHLLPHIFLLTLILVAGKIFGVTLGSLLSGKPLDQSIQAGTSMAQIGEFSFLIATLGLNLKVIRPELYPLAVIVSAISTFLTPYLIRRAPWIYKHVEKRVPQSLFKGLLRYQSAFLNLGQVSLIPALVKAVGIKIVLNLVMVLAVSFASRWLSHFLIPLKDQTGLVRLGFALLDLVLISPFLWAIWLGRLELKRLTKKEVDGLQKFHLGISVVRTVLVVYLVIFALGQFVPVEAVSGLLLILVGGFLAVGRKVIRRWYLALEGQLLSHIHLDEPALLPWNVDFGEYEVHPHSVLVGQTLKDSGLRAKYGVSVSLLRRGEKTIIPSSSKEMLMPYDHVFLVGDETQLMRAGEAFEDQPVEDGDGSRMIGLKRLIVQENSGFDKKAIRDCGIKEKFQGLIVGVERGSERILNPPPDLVLKQEDILWVLGNLRRIE
jgi:CPA2 family monovalent cation:H+ antiporter-2